VPSIALSSSPAAVKAGPSTVSRLLLGVVHTQHSADAWNNATAVRDACSVLRSTSTFQSVSIMGWGTENPEPSPGVYNWSTLDDRIRLVTSTGGTPVIVLCGAPDWMKGGQAGHTDWSQIEKAPLPSHYGDFAQLAVAVAKRYPFVHYFEVWNEFKGFWSDSRNRWNYEAYTQLYNTVADALLAYNPALKIGGPYAPIDVWNDPNAGGHPSTIRGPWGTVDQRPLDAVVYWLAHAHHPSFLCVDGGLRTKENRSQRNLLAATGYYKAVTKWLRARTRLPIWWSEWYTNTAAVGPSTPRRWVALSAASALQLSLGGASVATLWDPEQYPGSSTPGLWTCTATPAGGQATGLAPLFQWMKTYCRPGTTVRQLGPAVGVIGMRTRTRYVAVNTTSGLKRVAVARRTVILRPYAIVMGTVR
jgi:hypothetical protein